MKLPEITRRSRLYALVVMLAMQTLYFGVFIRSGPQFLGDNVRYEMGGWQLARGRGLALPFEMSPDPDVRDWVCSRHPEACTDGAYPSAQYPPGYQFFIAGVYLVAGRSLWAIAIAQLLCLWGLFACFEILAAKSLQKVGYWFAIGVACTYPFLARQFTYIMADGLHCSLLVASITALMTMKPGLRRGLLFGFLFGAATFVRTYSVVAIPFLFAWPRLFRAFRASRKEWVVAFAVCVLPFALWTVRNEYWFGRLIPFSTTGIGASLYLNKTEVEIGEVYDEGNATKIAAELNRNGEDMTNWRLNKTLGHEAVGWIREHPAAVAGRVVARVPRLWISKGEMSKGVSRSYPLFVLYLGGLLVLGVAGMWLKRRDGRWNAVMLIILFYWGFLLHTPAEARRTLPLRLPMLVFAAFAVEEGVRRFRARGAARSGESAPPEAAPEAPPEAPEDAEIRRRSA